MVAAIARISSALDSLSHAEKGKYWVRVKRNCELRP
jgi:hypothetical protein